MISQQEFTLVGITGLFEISFSVTISYPNRPLYMISRVPPPLFRRYPHNITRVFYSALNAIPVASIPITNLYCFYIIPLQNMNN